GSCARSRSPKTPGRGFSRSPPRGTSGSPPSSRIAPEAPTQVLQRLEEIPAQWAERRPDAIVLREGERSWTWSELERSRVHLAGRLEALGVRAGDRVMLVGENCAAMVALFFALSTLDAWIVNVNARMSPREIELI